MLVNSILIGKTSLSTDPPILTTIVVTPANANLVVGEEKLFTATGKDQYGNTYPISSPVWTTSGGGNIMHSGTTCMYQATLMGSYTITCRQDGTTIQDTAEISTTNAPSQLTTIVLAPANANLVVGEEKLFTATGKDQYGNTYPISDPKWEDSGGTLTPNGTTCTYNAEQIGDHTIACRQQGTSIQGTAAIHITTTGVETKGSVPSVFYLTQNFPNPFNSSTIISYGVKQPSHVILTVYDILGKKVATLVNTNHQAGIYTIRYNADRMMTGIYYLKIQMNDFVCVRKMLLVQ